MKLHTSSNEYKTGDNVLVKITWNETTEIIDAIVVDSNFVWYGQNIIVWLDIPYSSVSAASHSPIIPVDGWPTVDRLKSVFTHFPNLDLKEKKMWFIDSKSEIISKKDNE